MVESDLFDFQAPKGQFAVMGNPVAHSKSPAIHQLFASQFQILLEYNRIQVDPGGFDQAVSHFAAHGGAGLNITVPFKVEAWQLCRRPANRLSDRARVSESVNTLKFCDDGSVLGDNTDGIGIVRDIQHNLQCNLQRKKIMLLGAGGAVRGVLGPILQCEPAEVLVVNRTVEKAVTLANRFRTPESAKISGAGIDQFGGCFDVVINGTAASLGGQLPAINAQCIGPETLAYDMMYGEEPTLFMKWALSQGARQASDGLGMLVEQAAESFFIWHDRRPQSAPVISTLRKS
jgi:shikimate dehydrogenase